MQHHHTLGGRVQKRSLRASTISNNLRVGLANQRTMSGSSGSSRRSHTKSRKGCKTCKRRHIRCDETYPQCNNCTRHHVTCDYMETASAVDPSSPSVDPPISVLPWSTEIGQTIDKWRAESQVILSDVSIDLSDSPEPLTRSDLQVIYSMLLTMQTTHDLQYTVWAGAVYQALHLQYIPLFLVHALMALHMSQIAFEQSNSEAKELAYHYRGVALTGLFKECGAVTAQNVDALMFASVFLSWQAVDVHGWHAFIERTRLAISFLHAHEALSAAPHFVKEQTVAISKYLLLPNTSPAQTTPTYASTLKEIQDSLTHVTAYVPAQSRELSSLRQLQDYIRRLQSVEPAQTPEERFNHLHSLRKWVLWTPPVLLKTSGNTNMTLLVIAHLYAVALRFELLFPKFASMFCGHLVTTPLQRILDHFEALQLQSDLSPGTGAGAGASRMRAFLSWPQFALNEFLPTDSRHFSPSPGPVDALALAEATTAEMTQTQTWTLPGDTSQSLFTGPSPAFGVRVASVSSDTSRHFSVSSADEPLYLTSTPITVTPDTYTGSFNFSAPDTEMGVHDTDFEGFDASAGVGASAPHDFIGVDVDRGSSSNAGPQQQRQDPPVLLSQKFVYKRE